VPDYHDFRIIGRRIKGTLLYINYLPLRINSLPCPTIFADDTNVIICSKDFHRFRTGPNLFLSHRSKFFAANKFALKPNKTNIINFATNNLAYCAISLAYKEQYIDETVKTKLLRLQTDKHLDWKCVLSYVDDFMQLRPCCISKILTL
jgi:hypothetical protein